MSATKPENGLFDWKPERRREAETVEEEMLTSSHPEARELYDLAIKVKKLSPWNWMEETDVFGVEDPDTGDIGFVSIMGSVGEYQAVAVYLGAEGLHAFIDLQEDEDAVADRILEISHLQVAFSDRQFLEKADRDLIKQLGLKFRGPDAWPIFRRYRPGYLPWFVTLAETRFLINTLSATLNFATRVRDDLDSLPRPTRQVEEGGHLVLVPRRENDQLELEFQVRDIPRPSPIPLRNVVDDVFIDGLKRLQQSNLELETDLLLAPARIGKANERPLAVYVVMVADKNSGFLFGVEMITAKGSLAAMHEQVPNIVAKLLLQANIMPKRLIVRSDLLRSLLRSFTQRLNIELLYSDELPSIDEATESMGQWMRGGKLG